jgi:hypothetical protein
MAGYGKDWLNEPLEDEGSECPVDRETDERMLERSRYTSRTKVLMGIFVLSSNSMMPDRLTPIVKFYQ